MKKVDIRRLKHLLHAAKKRSTRGKRIKGRGAPASINPIFLKPNFRAFKANSDYSNPRVQAPPALDLYSKDSFELFCNFIINLEAAAKYNDRVIICFRDTNHITAAAALRLLAQVSHLLKTHPNLSFGCSVPNRRRGKYKNMSNAIEGVLQQIGFFSVIGQPERAPSKEEGISVWRQLSGNLADGSLAANLLNSLPQTISKQSKAQLYKGAIEAMANSVDHAYPVEHTSVPFTENRWWMLVGTKKESITLIVCDLGVGIPVTLPKKHPESMLKSIFQKIGIIGNGDAELIHASTFIKRTRTNQTHRGKGGADIRSITEHFPSALLSIRSNRGCYVVAGPSYPGTIMDDYRAIPDTEGREWSASYSGSICGTLIEWTVSVKELEE